MTNAQVARLIGVSYRQIQWWGHRGFIRRGGGRTYKKGAPVEYKLTPEEVRRCVVLAQWPKWHKRAVTALSSKMLACRYILIGLVHGGWRVLAATDNQDEVIKIATAATCGVRLIHIPEGLL